MFEGSHDATGLRFGLVVSRFNEFVTERLLTAAVDMLAKAGADPQHLVIAKVPGAFEIPQVARRLACSRRYDAVICLGAVIRGETPHFDYICSEASRGIADAARDSGIPVIFGVLTTDTAEQALERSGGPDRNRGAEAARTAIEMATLLRQLGTVRGTHATPRSRKRRRLRRGKR
ncbi:MAG: 6,7-dimethyl-8-ribityllumazine synthase [Nitrospirales bacterium]